MSRPALRTLLARYGTALGALAAFAGFALLSPTFTQLANLLNITKQISFLAILALGFGLALTVAELDLSFANVCSLAAVVTGGLVHHGHPPALAVAAGLAVGLGCGTVNGLVVTGLRIPSLIATLAMAVMANGFAFMATDGVAFVGRWAPGFVALGRATLLGLPVLSLWTAGLALLAWHLLDNTRLGLRMAATGEAAEAARLAGVPVARLKLLGLALSGLLAGAAAVLLTASLSSAAPTAASDLMLSAIAAVLLGMTMFRPGRPNVPGILVGALTIGMIDNGLVLLGAPYYIRDIALGLIIVASVSISSSVLRRAAFGV